MEWGFFLMPSGVIRTGMRDDAGAGETRWRFNPLRLGSTACALELEIGRTGSRKRVPVRPAGFPARADVKLPAMTIARAKMIPELRLKGRDLNIHVFFISSPFVSWYIPDGY
jgi:hypothetical protein